MGNPIAGWNGNLPTDTLLDSGVLYLGTSIFSATSGGLKFDPQRQTRDMEFDGRKSPVALLDRTIYVRPMITGVVYQVPSTSFASLEPGASTVSLSGGPSGSTQIQPKAAGTMYVSGDYISNVRAVWYRANGTYVQIRFPKGICDKWDMAGRDREEVLFSVNFGARLDMGVSGNLLQTPPYVIEYFATLDS